MPDNTKTSPDTTKDGAPTKYKPEMIGQCQEYIANCPNVFPSIKGFGLYIGIPSKRIQAWKALDSNDLDPIKWPRFADFQDILDQMQDTQCVVVLDKGSKREMSEGIAKLVLGKHGYHNTTDITSNGESIMPSISIG